jgi:hypothetical protein
MASKQGYTVFAATVPRIVRDLMRDFPGITENDCFAICGNLGHESAGFTAFQEIKPTVAGSAGGWGWAQWTGMGKTGRRRLFNEWCAAQGIKDLKSYEANYGYLAHELKTSEAGAIKALKAASDLRAKVEAFEKVFERAGVPAMDSRYSWALRAKAANEAARAAPAPLPDATTPKAPLPEVPLKPTPPLKQAPPKKVVPAKKVSVGIGAAFVAWLSTQGWKLGLAAGIVLVAIIVGVSVYKRFKSK